MFDNHIKWRNENNIDGIINDFKFDEKVQSLEYNPRGYVGVDKVGLPVFVERFGYLQFDKLFEITTEERHLRSTF